MIDSAVPAVSTIGLGFGAGVNVTGITQAPMISVTAEKITNFLMIALQGLGLTHDLHELCDDIPEHALRQSPHLAMNDLPVDNK